MFFLNWYFFKSMCHLRGCGMSRTAAYKTGHERACVFVPPLYMCLCAFLCGLSVCALSLRVEVSGSWRVNPAGREGSVSLWLTVARGPRRRSARSSLYRGPSLITAPHSPERPGISEWKTTGLPGVAPALLYGTRSRSRREKEGYRQTRRFMCTGCLWVNCE